jgi:site-specific DNA-methyltransferase (adenine-specific)
VSTFREEIIGDCRLILGDCREVLPTLGPVDAVITDPPYAVSQKGVAHVKQGRGGSRRLDFFEGDDDWAAMTALVAEAAGLAIDKLGPRASMYWWCGHRQFNALTTLFEERGFSTRFLVWTKTCPPPAPPGAGWPSAAELCLYAFRPGRVFNGSPKSNVIVGDTYRFGQPGKVDHPTQKPLHTIHPLLAASTLLGDTVLDPFMGSGSTGVGCVQVGRSFIGIEREPSYFDIACRRIEEAYKQPRLFAEPPPKPVQPSMFTGGEAA